MHTKTSIAQQTVQPVTQPAADTEPLKPIDEKLLQGTAIQCSLSVGAPDDPLEDEADAMADTVMRMPLIQRKCSHCAKEENIQRSIQLPYTIQRKCAHCEEEESIQRKTVTPFIQTKSNGEGNASASLTSRINNSRGNGGSMDEGTRTFMEHGFNSDFSNITIHTGSESVQMNRELNAKAFTVGNDIYFNEGQYNPNSDSGKHLLAHELTHTIQQGKSSVMLQRVCNEQIGNPTGCNFSTADIYSFGVDSQSHYRFLTGCDDFLPGEADRLVTTLSAINFPGGFVTVHGFSSEEGPPGFNERLSCARALAAISLIRTRHPQGAALQFRFYSHGATPGGRPDHRAVVISLPQPPAPIPPPERRRFTIAGCTETSPGVIPIRDFIRYIETIEREFAGESPQKILSMVRRMYYGSQLFDRLLPDAPPGVLRRTVCTDSEGIERPAGAAGPITCSTVSERSSYSREAEDAITHLSVHPNENGIGDNPSPYIFADGECIDLGHLLLAIDALLHPRTSSPYSDQGLPAIDPANWAADIGIGMVWYEEHAGNHHASADVVGAPATADINAYYRISLPSTDLLGDVDAFDISTLMSGGQRLSQVMRTFYISESGGSPRIGHYRWTSFVAMNRFTYTRSGDTITWDPATIQMIERRVRRFADVWAFRADMLRVGLTIVPHQAWPHTSNFVTLFLNEVKAGLENELIRNP